MTQHSYQFQLTVQRVEQTCLFSLTGSQMGQLTAAIPFPTHVIQHYQQWKRAYLDFYQTVQLPITVAQAPPTQFPGETNGLRGKRVGGGHVIAAQNDRRMSLVEAELRLLNDFHKWLRHEDLYDIRAKIAQTSRDLAPSSECIDIFLTCSPIDLARLPWEAWEIGAEFAGHAHIRIARAPANIHETVLTANPRSQRRPRVLAILGDDTRLDIEGDRRAMQSLRSVADIQIVGWRPDTSIDTLKTDIIQAIADEKGWDILFFAGHSNEKADLGGELAIAPNTAIALNEIKPHLQIAQQRGLQFALFNSCNGMDLAETLIDLGLSQVAVMREPIHNRVAEEFLIRFVQSLAEYNDVHTSLMTATEFLKVNANLTHPSTHWVPTLFRHPQSELFQLRPFGWRQRIRALMPTRYEAIALSLLMILSWQLPVQTWLLERRVLAQAIYRQVTQRATDTQTPPILLVQIDEESLDVRGIDSPNPMSRRYLADLIETIAGYQPPVIGVDYLLDRPHPETEDLSRVVEAAHSSQVNVVFVASPENGQWRYARPEISEYSTAGDIGIRRHHMRLPYIDTIDDLSLQDSVPPLSYALVNLAYPERLQFSRSRRSPWTGLSYNLGQRWLDPIIDYSIPPEQAYQAIPALSMFDPTAADQLQDVTDQIVLIAPGGYAEAGINKGGDNFTPTLAVNHWYTQSSRTRGRKLTGGEIHAYNTHHLVNQRLVLPVPDIWMVVLAAVLGKILFVSFMPTLRSSLGRSPTSSTSPLPLWEITILSSCTLLYSLISFELYLSSVAILFPIALPMLTFWVYAAGRLSPTSRR